MTTEAPPRPTRLTIETLAPTRETVTIDEKLYELKQRTDFGARPWFELQRDMREHDEVANREVAAAAAATALEQVGLLIADPTDENVDSAQQIIAAVLDSAGKPMTMDDFARLEQLAERMCEVVLDAPPKIRGKLSYNQKRDVVLAFQLAPLEQQETTAQTETTSPSTSES